MVEDGIKIGVEKGIGILCSESSLKATLKKKIGGKYSVWNKIW